MNIYSVLLTVGYDEIKGGAKAIFDAVANVYLLVHDTLVGSAHAAAELFVDGGPLDGLVNGVIDPIKTNVIDGLSGAAFAISLVFFLIALIQLTTERELTLEQFIKFFSKFVISVGAIMFCKELVDGCYGISVAMATFFNSVTSAVVSSISGSDTFSIDTINNNLAGMLEKPGILDCLGLAIKALPMCLILLLAAIAIYIVTYLVGFTRVLELTVRACFMPFALALLADDGWRGAGGRYIKKFLAVCCQSSVLIVIGGLTIGIMDWSFVNLGAPADDLIVTTDDLIATIMPFLAGAAAGFASISLMFKSISIINDAFGG